MKVDVFINRNGRLFDNVGELNLDIYRALLGFSLDRLIFKKFTGKIKNFQSQYVYLF